MKRKVRISLASICAVLLVICCVALGLYSFGYMGFEDGKLRFYFGKNIDNPDNPSTPGSPTEPEQPSESGDTIHLIWEECDKTFDYIYDSANSTFSPVIQNTWIKQQERQKKYYRFDGWYKDAAFSVPVNKDELKDGDTVYAKMVKQVMILIHASNPYNSSNVKEVRKDIGANFNIDVEADSLSGQIFGIYADEAMTQRIDGQFEATKDRDIFLDWSTPYVYFRWEISEGKASISHFEGAINEIKIPSMYRTKLSESYAVTRIEMDTFRNKTNLVNVTIPTTITEIIGGAFDGCTSLQRINITDLTSWCNIEFYNSYDNPLYYAHNLYLNGERIIDLIVPNEVTEIKRYAFSGLSNLTSIFISDSVTNIFPDAFSGCTGLREISVSSGNSVYHDSGNCLIETASKTLIVGCKTSVIPADGSVTTIGPRSFYDCVGLTTINIPASVTSISDTAIYNYNGLTNIMVSSGNTVYHSAGNCLIETESKTLVAGCKTSVIPTDGSVTSIGGWAFNGCTGLTSITIPDSVTSIGDGAFYDCNGLTTVVIGRGITSIGGGAFKNCSKLRRIEVNATTPPTISVGTFDPLLNSNYLIYVPSSSSNKYMVALYWSAYAGRIRSI